MRLAGIDIGSRTIKFVIIKDGRLIESRVLENSFDTLADCRRLLEGMHYDTITSTGYGRHLFADAFAGVGVVSEIKAFATGINFLNPDCRTILDIGGQDTKVILIDDKGAVRKFEMNDKCAAGTGRFLEVMAMALRTPLTEFAELVLKSRIQLKINSMCTVFAESEVVSLLAQGVAREDIAAGIIRSVVTRAVSQMRRVGIESTVAFAGGVALNKATCKLLSEVINQSVFVPEDPQIVGALGAAVCGGNNKT